MKTLKPWLLGFMATSVVAVVFATGRDDRAPASHASAALVGNTIKLGQGLTNSVNATTCQKGNDVLITGTNNKFQLFGPCRNLTVTGSSNRVHMNEVQSITLHGIGHSVSYSAVGGGKKEPAIKAGDVSNRVEFGTAEKPKPVLGLTK